MVGYLVLENGEIFEGERIGYTKDTVCEVVFNTSMVGYIETFTDPSYLGQGIVMTYPLIGNYGVMPEDYESDRIYAKAIFVHEVADFESNFRSKSNLEKFLRDYKIPGLAGINTRKLTRMLRESGSELKIYKNTLVARSLKTLNIDIEKELSKELRCYESKFEGYELKQRIKQKLYNKGYNLTLIEKVLEIPS